MASSNRYLSALKSFTRPPTYGFCKTNPAASVTTKKEPIKVKDVLDDDEFERLLTELPDYSWRIVLAASETGMRSGEIRRLRWEDVDLGAGELRVAIAKNKEFRVVPFTERMRAMLEDMEADAKPHPTAPVFEAVDIKKGLAAALKRAGIEKHVTLHSFRHQFATRALEAGVSSSTCRPSEDGSLPSCSSVMGRCGTIESWGRSTSRSSGPEASLSTRRSPQSQPPASPHTPPAQPDPSSTGHRPL